MQLKDLKDKILKKEYISFPLIFVSNGDNFIIKQYLNAIAQNQHLTILNINSLKELDDITSSMFFENDDLFVYNVSQDISLSKKDFQKGNVIIIAGKDIKETDIDVVKFDTIENWMIDDYACTLLPGVLKQEVQWLRKVCNYNIYRVDLECSKINCFEKKDQQKIFELINKENGYSDLSDLNIFNLSNAIIKKDIIAIKNIVRDIDNIDIEAVGLVTILLKQFLNIINIQLNKKANAASLGMSEKQFRAISYNCNKYSTNKIMNIYQFLNNLDYKLKSGLLDTSNKDLIQYILNNILDF